jgi:DNA-binding beta-propeller fold protein YncE
MSLKSPSRRRLAVAISLLLVVAGAGLAMPTVANAYSADGFIEIGAYSNDVAISPDGSVAYIAQGQGLSVADTTTKQVLVNIGDVGIPNAVAVSSDGKTVYTSSYSGTELSVIDTATRTKTGTLPSGSYGDLAVSPDGSTVFQTNYNYGTVTAVDVASATSRTIQVGGSATAAAISPDGKTLYVGGSSGVAFVDLATDAVAYVSVPDVYAMALSTNGSTIYSVSYITGQITAIDTTTRATTSNVVSRFAVGVAVSPDGDRVYVNDQARALVDVDAATLTVVASAPFAFYDEDGGPVSVSPDGLTAFAAARGGSSVSVFDLRESPVFTASTPATTATVGTSYSYTFAATGRPAPTFSASAPLPDGLILSPEGVISGTPSKAGTFTFTVTASNGLDPVAVSGSVTVRVAAAAVIPTPVSIPAVPAESTATLAATGAEPIAPLLGVLLVLGVGTALLLARRRTASC